MTHQLGDNTRPSGYKTTVECDTPCSMIIPAMASDASCSLNWACIQGQRSFVVYLISFNGLK